MTGRFPFWHGPAKVTSGTGKNRAILKVELAVRSHAVESARAFNRSIYYHAPKVRVLAI